MSPTSYSFEWYKYDLINQVFVERFSPNQSSVTVSDPGYYYYPVVKDSYGCFGYINGGVSLITTPPLTMSIHSSGNYCNTNQKGTAYVETVSGGTQPYSYSWKDGSNNVISTSSFISTLDPGTYTITVTDACGNTVTQTTSIVAVTPITVPTIAGPGITTLCSGSTFTLTASQGQTSDLTYRWYKYDPILQVSIDSISLNQAINVNSIGYYNISTLDKFGCYGNANGIGINPPNSTPLSVTINSNGVYCGSSQNTTKGYASASTSGGSFPITFLGWTMGGVSYSLTSTYIGNLTPGTYTATYADACGNTATNSVTIVEVTPIAIPTISASGPTNICPGGSVTLTVSQGQTADITYRWTKYAGNHFTDSISLASSINVTDSGSYNIYTKDKFGCFGSAGRYVSISNTALQQPFITNNGPTVICQGATVVLNVSNPDVNLIYQWKLNGIAIPEATTTSYAASASGSYTVMVSNGGTCTNQSFGVTVTVNPNPTTPIISGPSNISSCTNTNIGLSATGGNSADYTWFNSNGNFYFYFGSATANYFFSNPGTYTASVRSTVNGCTVTSAPVTFTIVAKPNSFSLSTPSGSSYCAGGTGVTINTNSSQVGFNYEIIRNGINTGIILAGTGSALSFIGNTIAGSYQVNATNLSGGCGVMSNNGIAVTILANPTIFTVSASGPLCASSSVNLIQQSGSETGVFYRRSIDGAAPVTVWSGTGSAISTIVTPTAGTYTYSAIRGTCVTNMTGSVVEIGRAHV